MTKGNQYLAKRIDGEFRHTHKLIGRDEPFPSFVQLTEPFIQGDYLPLRN